VQPPRPYPLDFFRQPDVWGIAQALLGAQLWVRQPGGRYAIGRIVETEAYAGPDDRASHAYGGRRTARTEVMFRPGGIAYVYLCYGIHHLLNVVTAGADTPNAVLIRAVELLHDIDPDLPPRKRHTRGAGPGRLTRALGVTTAQHNGCSLRGPELLLAPGPPIAPTDVVASPRIGVDYAGPDAALPWRYHLHGHPAVSKPA